MPTTATRTAVSRRGARAECKPKLTLSVQYATKRKRVPLRREFRGWLAAALESDAAITLRLVDETEARSLNHDYRGKDYATNVLTFVYDATPEAGFSGDIVLCAPVVAREARAQHKTLIAHYAHLAVHGALHLQGYDHAIARDAGIMQTREIAILGRLGFPDPYRFCAPRGRKPQS